MEPIEGGGWQRPRWNGCDPKLFAIISFAALLLFLGHDVLVMGVGFVVLGIAWIAFSRMFDVEPRQVEITASTWPLFNVDELSRMEDSNSRPVRHPRATR
jgi:hypothetical protein